MTTANTTKREAARLPVVGTYGRHEIRVNLNSLCPFVVWDTLSHQVVAQYATGWMAVETAEALQPSTPA